MADQTVNPKGGRLTAAQVSIAMDEIISRLQALERVSILLQCNLLGDQRDVDAMHTITQSVLQATGYIAGQVAAGVDEPSAFHGDDPMELFMPPLFFHEKDDAETSNAG